MHAHQEKAPICPENMEPASQGHAACPRQEGKYIAGHHNTAVHLSEHCKKEKQIDTERHSAQCAVFPLEQGFMPAPVQKVVGHKKKEHSGTHPFMGRFSPKLIAH